MTFKIGDKVKVTADHALLPCGSIHKVTDATGAFVYLDGNLRDSMEGWARHRFERVEEPKFKVGDRVRITYACTPALRDRWDGFEAEVVRPSPGLTYLRPLSLRPDGCQVTNFYWDSDHLTKIESVPFKLDHGDTVTNVKTGRVGEVIWGLVYDVNPPFKNPVRAHLLEEYEEQHPGTYDLKKKAYPW